MTDRLIESIDSLEKLYPILNREMFTAGWHKARPSLWKEPSTDFTTRLWKYSDARSYIDLAAQWIGTDKAERRNFLMFNPVQDNDYASLPNLVAAYQMLRPGEHARAHRHSPNALRLVLDADDEVYTVVDGIELPMQSGDILLTPSWTWHSHFDNGTKDAYWIDFLDVPLVHRMESMFFEAHPDQFQKTLDKPDYSSLRFTLKDQDEILSRSEELSNGICEATLDTPSMKTISLKIIQITNDSSTKLKRDSCSRFFSVIKGSAEINVENECYKLKKGDVIAVPIWKKFTIKSNCETRLLEVSDLPVQKTLGFYREEIF